VVLDPGDGDGLVLAPAARQAAEAYPHWRYTELSGVGHVPQLQVPDRVAKEVLGWLAETVTAPAARS
jgi:pimeloyl-ACP methyl ester carboxylesterase